MRRLSFRISEFLKSEKVLRSEDRSIEIDEDFRHIIEHFEILLWINL